MPESSPSMRIAVLGCQDADVANALTVLRREFELAEAGFLLCLRGEQHLVWDRASFSRFKRAIRTACEQNEVREDLPLRGPHLIVVPEGGTIAASTHCPSWHPFAEATQATPR